MVRNKNCHVTGCGRTAIWCPELHLWPQGYPKLDLYRGKLALRLHFCGEHLLGMTQETIVSDEVWVTILRSFHAVGCLMPDRGTIEIAWTRIIAEPTYQRADCLKYPDEQETSHPRPAGNGLRILVIEDEWLIALELQASLTTAGHVVIGPAASVAHALVLAEALRPEFALVDLNLGVGGDGAEAARHLMHRYGCPSLFLTGQPAWACANQDAALGMISKPADPDVVLAAIAVSRQMLAGRPYGHIPGQLVLFGSL